MVLAVAPRRQWGLWELLLFHKGATTVHCFVMWDKPDAVQTAFIDLFVRHHQRPAVGAVPRRRQRDHRRRHHLLLWARIGAADRRGTRR
ncbi:hypothetical protein [Streptosporangium sp. NPDC023615]|uniref:hypothetical protein n=1 Tax=Streptosporangium sp. NPDC023615 TaxID=3154794 RepID=UPI0034398A58